MGIRTWLVLGAPAMVTMAAAAACGDDEDATLVPLGRQTDTPTAVPTDNLLLSCAMTEAFSMEIPMLVARGQDPIPMGFDTISTGICEFSRPIESVTVVLDRAGKSIIGATTLETPVTQVRIPLDFEPGDPIPANLETGSYDHRIIARAVGGEEVELWSNPDNVWVLDPDVMPKDQAREVLQLTRAALGDIPLNSPMRTFEPVDWPDASLGCPETDALYAQVITPGFRLVFEADGTLHEYHTNDDGSLVATC